MALLFCGHNNDESYGAELLKLRLRQHQIKTTISSISAYSWRLWLVACRAPNTIVNVTFFASSKIEL